MDLRHHGSNQVSILILSPRAFFYSVFSNFNVKNKKIYLVMSKPHFNFNWEVQKIEKSAVIFSSKDNYQLAINLTGRNSIDMLNYTLLGLNNYEFFQLILTDDNQNESKINILFRTGAEYNASFLNGFVIYNSFEENVLWVAKSKTINWHTILPILKG